MRLVIFVLDLLIIVAAVWALALAYQAGKNSKQKDRRSK